MSPQQLYGVLLVMAAGKRVHAEAFQLLLNSFVLKHEQQSPEPAAEDTTTASSTTTTSASSAQVRLQHLLLQLLRASLNEGNKQELCVGAIVGATLSLPAHMHPGVWVRGQTACRLLHRYAGQVCCCSLCTQLCCCLSNCVSSCLSPLFACVVCMFVPRRCPPNPHQMPPPASSCLCSLTATALKPSHTWHPLLASRPSHKRCLTGCCVATHARPGGGCALL